MCTVRSSHHSLEPSIADSSPKQCLSLQFPKRHIIPIYIPAHTRICWIRSRVKNRATSQFGQNLNTRLLAKWVFFSLRTVKNHTLFSGLKTPQSTLTLTIRKKHNFQALGLCVLFPTLSIRKNTVSTQHILVNSQKKHTLLGSCLYVFFSPLHC